MTKAKILEQAKWNKDTCYMEQLTFVGPDGKLIHAVRTNSDVSRTTVENNLVERVQEVYGTND